MDIQLVDEPIKPLDQVEGCENGIDIQEYVNDHPYMYSGKAKKQTFLAKIEVLNDVLDWFGMDTKIEQVDDNAIRLTVNADEASFKYWSNRYSEYLISK